MYVVKVPQSTTLSNLTMFKNSQSTVIITTAMWESSSIDKWREFPKNNNVQKLFNNLTI